MINCENNCSETTVVTGNSVDINLNDEVLCKSAEIRSDIVVDEFSAKRIWGQVKNCRGEFVANSMVKLVKVICNEYGQQEYLGVAHTITDCQGFYQFDICADDMSCYKIIVNKATTGIEAVMMNEGGNCNLCQGGSCGNPGNGYNPCNPVDVQYVNNPSKCECNRCKETNWCENPKSNKNKYGNPNYKLINNKSMSR